jgi:hypothetical protein
MFPTTSAVAIHTPMLRLSFGPSALSAPLPLPAISSMTLSFSASTGRGSIFF